MGNINWDLVPHFNRWEFDDPNYPGSGDYTDGTLLIMVVKLRLKTNWPIVTHNSVGGAVDVDGVHGHSIDSYHLLKNGCQALDFHFRTDTEPRIQFYEVMQLGFGGTGIYYDWNWNGRRLPIGFHVDTRSKERTQIWKRDRGNYLYFLN